MKWTARISDMLRARLSDALVGSALWWVTEHMLDKSVSTALEFVARVFFKFG